MSKLLLYPLLIVSLLLISCSGTTNQYISPDYENQNSNDSVSIFKIEESDFSETNPDHTFGTLSAAETSLFNERLFELFSEATAAEVTQHLNFSDFPDLTFQVRHFDQNGTSLHILAPEKGSKLTNDGNGVSPRFVLLLDGYNFNIFQDLAPGFSYGGHEPETVTKANFETKYLIWDNQIQDAVGWGKVNSEQVVNLAQINEEYDNLILQTIKEMIPRSPFAPRRS